MTKSISNTQDIIDSRDVISRIEELQDERADLVTAAEEAETAFNDADAETDAEADASLDLSAAREAISTWDEDEGAELRALLALQEDAEDYCPDWKHGAGLIRDSYFMAYAQELAEDIGAIDPKATWPNDCIDWERAAGELQMDYTSVDFDGVEYWVR